MPGGLVCLLRLRLFYHSPAHPLSGNITARAPCTARGRSGSASLEEFWLPAWRGEISKFFLKFRMNCVRSSAQQLAVGSFTHSSPRCLPQPDCTRGAVLAVALRYHFETVQFLCHLPFQEKAKGDWLLAAKLFLGNC